MIKLFQVPSYEDLELSTQIVIKEAKKRDIKVEVLDRKENFISLKKGTKREFIMQGTRTSADNYIVPLIMGNKLVTKKILEESGIKVPKGKYFISSNEASKSFEEFKDKKIIIKPKSTNFGTAVKKIEKGDKELFNKAIEEAFLHDDSVLIEEFIEGDEYRFLVIGGRVVAILKRISANVIGDGISTISELIDKKNSSEKRGKDFSHPLIFIKKGKKEEKFLEEQGFSFDTVLEKGKKVFLRNEINALESGGDTIDFTDKIEDIYKELAVKAVNVVGAKICGVDAIISKNSKNSEKNFTVLELNFNPVLFIHDFPYQGKNRNTAKFVLDLIGF